MTSYAEWLEHAYREGRSVNDIADEVQTVGTSPAAIRAVMRAQGLTVRNSRIPYGVTVHQRRLGLTAEFLQREYVEAGRTTYDIAAELGCSRLTVSDALFRLGIEARRHGRGPASQLTAEFLQREYVEAGRTMGDIADEIGTSPVNIMRAMRRHGIASRPRGVRLQ